MAFFPNQLLPSFLLLLCLLLLLLLLPLCHSSTSTSTSIHDLLRSMGLPPGLFPKEVQSYNFSGSGSGLLQVYLERPCLTKFDTMALYDIEVRANLSHGSLTGVEGLSQEELFLWLPVKDIIVDDPTSGLILIDIGVAHKQLSLSLFEDPPDCTTKSQSGLKELKGRKERGFVAHQV